MAGNRHRALLLAIALGVSMGLAEPVHAGLAQAICEPPGTTVGVEGRLLQPTAARAPASAQGTVEALGIDARLRQAEQDRRTGRIGAALAGLREALGEAEALDDRRRVALVSGSLGVALQAAGRSDQAYAALLRSLEMARETGAPRIEAATLSNLGNWFAAREQTVEALESYERAAQLARQSGDASLAARVSLNAASLLGATGDNDGARRRVDDAIGLLGGMPDARRRAAELVSAGLVARELAGAGGGRDDLLIAHRLFLEASTTAKEANDRRTESYALGHLATLYMAEGRNDEALQLTRRALFLAQAAEAPEALYRWQWQVGRLLVEQGDRQAAIQAYRGAVDTLEAIRQDLPAFDPETGQSLFRETVGLVYLELADLLLQSDGDHASGAQLQLVEARTVVEQLKTAELEDYFQDDCVALLQARAQSIETTDETSAVLYPVILPDRLELLLTVPDGVLQARVPVPASMVEREANAFRDALENIFIDSLPGAQQLYRWLIAPFADALDERGIQTLVFVPDGALRQIPLAALHDGQQFLIETFAVAIAPGMSLLAPRRTAEMEILPLIGGLSGDLPAVRDELEAIADLYGGTVLAGETFNPNRLQSELQETPYTVVHIASHARFSNDPESTFVTLHGGRLSIDGLEELMAVSRFRDDPVELLALSACETAAGNDRAALGLAGIAIKAGARSALATMWPVDDSAAAQLSREFYRNLKTPGTSKARALQQAQATILQSAADPVLWTPFVLIGNWL